MSEFISSDGTHDHISEAEYKLYSAAEQTIDDPRVAKHYADWNWIYSGAKSVEERHAGFHPWQERETHHGRRVYSVPVVSGYNAESGDMLYVGHDDWIHPDDPTSFLVARGNLHTGSVTEYYAAHSHVDYARQGYVHIIHPNTVSNWPPNYCPEIHAPAYDQTRVNFNVDQMFRANSAEIRAGLHGGRNTFELIDSLNAMRRMILDKNFEEFRRAQEFERHRGIALGVSAHLLDKLSAA